MWYRFSGRDEHITQQALIKYTQFKTDKLLQLMDATYKQGRCHLSIKTYSNVTDKDLMLVLAHISEDPTCNLKNLVSLTTNDNRTAFYFTMYDDYEYGKSDCGCTDADVKVVDIY